MSLAVGIVVDDAIMVLENIHRHFDSGKDRVRAAREGTHGDHLRRAGRHPGGGGHLHPGRLHEGGHRASSSCSSGSPCAWRCCSRTWRPSPWPRRARPRSCGAATPSRNVVGRLADRAFDRLARGYAWVLAPGAAPARAWCCWVRRCCWWAPASCSRSMPSEFVPSQDQSRLNVRLQTAVGSDLEETDKLLKRAEAFVHEPARGGAARSWSSAASGAATSTPG